MTEKADKGPSDGVFYSVSIAIVVLGLVFGFFGLPRLFRSSHAANVGKDAPSFKLPVMTNGDGQKAIVNDTLALSALKGSPVLLDYWATWCGPCQAEAPVVDRIYRRHKDRGLVVLGINVNARGDTAGVTPWVQRKGLSFTILHDVDNSASAAFDVQNIPTLVLISREGKVAAIRTGVTSDEDLDRLVKDVL
jgi:thiol-disulfide isomerase/thioredoxin